MSRFLGESISKEVVDQLTRRARLADKSTPVLEDRIKVQQFLQSRGVWIRLFSSVNEITEVNNKIVEEGSAFKFNHPTLYSTRQDNTDVSPTKEDPGQNRPSEPKSQTKASVKYSVKDIVSNSELAKKYILSGGELEWDGSKFISRQGINFDNNESSRKAYNFTSTFGSRPVPGITSFSITCKNRFCSVREASINFNVWSLEDFKAIQKLYFRPGFSVVLEWGDSLYIDETNSIVESLQSGEKENIKKLFSDTIHSDVEDIIDLKKEALGTSYDSFIGYIANFNWSLRQDGGYDCSIKVVSKGSVVESITVEKSVSYNTEVQSEDYTNFGYRERSIFHSILDKLQSQNDKFTDASIKEIDLSEFKLRSSKITIPVASVQLIDSDSEKEKAPSFHFITLRSLLKILNNFYLYFNIQDKEKALEFRFDADASNKYLTFSNHFSIAPLECFLPKTATQEDLQYYQNKDASITPLKRFLTEWKSSFHLSGLSHKLKDFYKTGEDDEILNIGISINKIVDIFDEILGNTYASLESKNIYDFLKKLFTILNENLGGINDFDLQIDEGNNAFIVDRNFTAFGKYKKGTQEESNVVENLKLFGITSLISNLEVNSTISSEIASQVAISAQPGLVPDQQVNRSLLEWNTGLKDRFSPSRSSTPIEGEGVVPENYDEKREVFLSAFKEQGEGIFFKLNNFTNKGSQKIGERYVSQRIFDKKSKELINFLRPEFKTRTNAAFYGSQVKSNTPLNGLIPINLQFTIDGISGFKIGQCFSIGTLSNTFPLLPDEYSSYSYIIRGVEHSIQNNKWLTTISAIPFKPQRNTLSNDELKEIKKDTTLGEY